MSTAPAARAALAAALHDRIGDWAANHAPAILRELAHDGWDITPAGTTSKEPPSSDRPS